MPGGGTWVAQNKKLPGAYINFVSVPRPVGILGTRGVVAIALPMIWGAEDELIEVYGSDLIDGKSLAKIGCTAFDSEISLPYRLALSRCYKALFFRSDKGGVKATKAQSPLTISAKYAGSVGNNIAIAIIDNKRDDGTYTVQVIYKEVLKEEFVVKTLGELELVESEWVNFTVSTESESLAPTPTAGINLTGGTNGTVNKESYTKFFELLKRADWQCMAIQTSDETVPPLEKDFIALCRDELGKKVQAACTDYDTDYEGIIKCSQGYKTKLETVSPELFQIWVASQTAGAAVNQSNTGLVVEDAVDIVNYYDKPEVEKKLATGWFVLSERQDGAIVVEQDINSYHSFTVNKNKEFRKNRIIRVLDEIGNTTALIFNRNYLGKMDNNEIGRSSFLGELINLCDTLQNENAIQEFKGAEDISVMQGDELDAVLVEFTIKPVDAMEYLYMTVNVRV